MAPNWFADTKPVRHWITFPGARDQAAQMRAGGREQADVDAFLDDHTFWVELRELTAGERARLEELRFTQEGLGTLAFGQQKLMTVESCLVAWGLEGAPDVENLARLKPLVLDEIFAKIDDGRLMPDKDKDAGKANGSGPPPPAIEMVATAKDAPPRE